MKRGIAALFLVLIAFYLAPVGVDRCEENPSGGVEVCHLLCEDGCATAPIPEPPAPPPPDVLPRLRFETDRIEQLISLQPEPEKDPPRARA